MLIGAYFTQEYALESAALFNPSMVWHPDQSGLDAGSAPVRAQPARHRRRAYLVDHVPQRHDRRREPHPHGRADAVRDGAGAGAQHALRQDPVLPQAARAGRRRPVYRQGPGHAQRPVHARRAAARHHAGPCTRAGRATRERAGRPGDAHPGQGQLRDQLFPRAAHLGAGHLPLRRPPRPTASRTPGSSSSTTTTARSATTPPTPPSTAR